MRGFVVGVLTVLFAATGAGAASINLIANSDFDDADGISGWISGAPIEWDANLDVDTDPNSGSIRIINEAEGAFIVHSASSDCVPVAEVDYELRTWVYIPSGQANTTDGAFAFLSLYASPNCANFLESVFPEEPRVALLDQWQLYKGTVRVPAAAQSARMGVDISKNGAGGSFVANHDAVSLRVAALVSEDSRFGAGTITRDTATGLGWLDVTLSTSISYDEILLELVPGGAFEEFRLATSAELLEFWVNAGINIEVGFFSEFTTENFLPIVDLQALVGVTGQGSLGGGNFFDLTNGFIESVPDSRGFITAGSLGADPDPTLTARPSFGLTLPDTSGPLFGSFLVLVPEPEADALTLAALAAVVFLVCKNTSRPRTPIQANTFIVHVRTSQKQN